MTVLRLSIAAFAVAAAAACGTQSGATAAPVTAAAAAQAPAPAAEPDATAPTQTLVGTVEETIGADQYTYVRLKTATGDAWLAAPGTDLKKGERLTAAIDMSVDNFHSKSLNRDFPVLHFASSVARDGETLPVATAPALAASHGAGGDARVDVARNDPPAGGMSIADVWARRASLSGKTVLVRGTVVKVNNQIMGKNWIHVQDGSGAADKGTHDLTVTTSAEVTRGDVVTVSGTLAIDQDFGSGYAYPALIEKATVTK